MDVKSLQLFDVVEYRLLTRGICLAKSMLHETDNQPIELEECKNRIDDLSISDKLLCSFCNTTFKDRLEQRTHYKLDWHRFNLKQKLAGLKPVTQDKFSSLTENDNSDISSISGSESSSEDESESSEAEMKTKSRKKQHQPMNHMKVYYQNDEGVVFSVYRCILHNKKQPPEKEEDLSRLAMALAWKMNWAVVMLTGGHFAAAIFQGSRPILHKTFHFYTVRAGQGRAQSTRDQKGGCKSAGSSLRRHNENCLNQRVQELLNSWKDQLTSCSIILVRAAGASGRTLFQGKEAPLDRNDSRIRVIPIPTRRATYKEVERVHSTIATIQIYGSAESLDKSFRRPFSRQNPDPSTSAPAPTKQGKKAKHDRGKERKLLERSIPGLLDNLLMESEGSDDGGEPKHTMVEKDVEITFADQLQMFENEFPKPRCKEKSNKPKKVKKKKGNKVTEKDEKENKEKSKSQIQIPALNSASQLLYERLIEICKSDDSNNLTDFFNKQDHDFVEIVNHQDAEGATALHLVSQLGKDSFVSILLSNGADPALFNSQGKPPYATAASKSVRHAFRRFQAAEPERYRYNKAQIPGPLTPEMEQEMAEKAKEQRRMKKKKEKEKERQLKEETDKERFLRLTDREKCALAAERRVMALASRGGGPAAHLVQSRCFQCGRNITGKVPFEYANNRFCEMKCLKNHRKATAAAAAAAAPL